MAQSNLQTALRLLGATALLLAAGCGKPSMELPPTSTYEITGTLTRDGEPAVNASIHLLGSPLGVVVDGDGGFRIRGVTAGNRALSVVFLGYRSAGVPVTVPGGAADDVALSMVPDGRVGPPLVEEVPELELSYRVGGGS